MYSRTQIFTLVFFIFSVLIVKGQDPYFSQFFANRLYLNPAFAGVENNRKISLNYRNQWPAMNNAYVTYGMAYDQFIEPMNGGVGMMIFNDNQGNGVITEFGLSVIYSYHLYVTRELTVNAGFQASYVQRKLNASNFIFEDMLNPDGTVLPSGSESYGTYRSGFPDFAVGFTSFYKGYYSGIAMYHLLKPVHSMSSDPDSRLSRKITVFAGGMIPVYEKRLGKEVLQLSPNIIYLGQKTFNQLNYGLETHFKNMFVAGIWLRQNLGIKYSSLIFSGGYVIERIRIRYSYDHQLTSPSVNISSLGAHEISLILTLDKGKKISHRAIKCPKI